MTDAMADQEPRDIRPVIARRAGNRSVWIFAGIAAFSAIGLFSVLEARRAAITSPATGIPSGTTSGVISPPPELAIPPMWPQYSDAGETSSLRQVPGYPARPAASPMPASSPPVSYATREVPPVSVPTSVVAAPGFSSANKPGFAYQAPEPKAPVADAAANSKTDDTRANAKRFENPATTVPQGTVIQAVLETALDSNRAGFARAVISRDVSGFDGSRVLIPKGSKLFGEYKSDLTRGQNRALIQWHRLTRPDGSIIDVDSPAADPLGRVGVKGKVNSHFFERFGGAILQSALDIGVQLAARRASGDTIILGLPNAQAIAPIAPENIRPTLKVRQGTSVSVFVGRDLDFTSVEQ